MVLSHSQQFEGDELKTLVSLSDNFNCTNPQDQPLLCDNVEWGGNETLSFISLKKWFYWHQTDQNDIRFSEEKGRNRYIFILIFFLK